MCVVYTRKRQPPPKHYMLGVDPNDEVRETIINYVEEGCPDVDQVNWSHLTVFGSSFHLFF
jgi:hypothetical protein